MQGQNGVRDIIRTVKPGMGTNCSKKYQQMDNKNNGLAITKNIRERDRQIRRCRDDIRVYAGATRQ